MLPDHQPLGSGGIIVGTGTGTGPKQTAAARVGEGRVGEGRVGEGKGAKTGDEGGGQKGVGAGAAGDEKKALSGAAAKAGEVVFGVVAAVVLGGVLMVL